jgi:prepilin-type N-terminal cleavage/methylation domain-containing protein/prepilin-type processing-associated H-X9-DG protein
MFEDNLNLNGFGERGTQPQIQKWAIKRKMPASAFTLIELLVVIAIIAILAAILMPVLAAAKRRGLEAQCINNLKELQTGWELYGTDNQDYMLPNSPFGTAANESWCPNGGDAGGLMGWGNSVGNTNTAVFTNTILAPYMSGQLGVYRCPADTYPSQNGLRVRDYSMQGQVGNLYCKGSEASGKGTLSENPDGIAYVKVTELRSAPGPSDVIVFLEEHPNSLLNGVNDGYLQVDSSASDAKFPDVPGSLHHWNAGMSFADGHVEMHKWITPVLQLPVVPNPPNGSIYNPLSEVQAGSTPLNVDWSWFATHCSALNPTPGS